MTAFNTHFESEKKNLYIFKMQPMIIRTPSVKKKKKVDVYMVLAVPLGMILYG